LKQKKSKSVNKHKMKSANSSNFAGLIIDMQPEFLKFISPKEKENMIQCQVNMIHYFSDNGIPLFILEFCGQGKTIEDITKRIDFSKNERPIIKTIEDGFYRTGLHQLLKKQKSKKIILMGINAYYCVKETAEGAIDKGYEIYTARNLIAEKARYTDREMNTKIENWYNTSGTYFKTQKQLEKFLQFGKFRNY